VIIPDRGEVWGGKHFHRQGKETNPGEDAVFHCLKKKVLGRGHFTQRLKLSGRGKFEKAQPSPREETWVTWGGQNSTFRGRGLLAKKKRLLSEGDRRSKASSKEERRIVKSISWESFKKRKEGKASPPIGGNADSWQETAPVRSGFEGGGGVVPLFVGKSRTEKGTSLVQSSVGDLTSYEEQERKARLHL